MLKVSKIDFALFTCYCLGFLLAVKRTYDLIISTLNSELVDGWGLTILALLLFTCLIIKHFKSAKQLILGLLLGVIIYLGSALILALIMS